VTWAVSRDLRYLIVANPNDTIYIYRLPVPPAG
jgi:hypothetical protein